MRFSFVLPFAALLVLPFGACKKKPSPRPGPGAQGGPATAASVRLPDLIKKYKAMSAAERMQAAKNGCYVSSECNAVKMKALFAAASGAEKTSLEAAARPVFARQYEKELVDKGKKPDSVTASGKDGTTLEVKGPPCNRFLLSNFMNDFGDRARTLGFKQVACENKALKAKIDL